jgi:hypothetical protein
MKAVVFYESAGRPGPIAPNGPGPFSSGTLRAAGPGTLRVNTSCIVRKNLATMSPVTAGPGGSRLAA